MALSLKQIRKRDGRIVPFDQEKITTAIFKAAEAVGGKDKQLAQQLSDRVAEALEEQYDGRAVPGVEDIQDIVEKVLIENGHARTAKAYILYRQKHKELRQLRELVFGRPVTTKLSLNALKVLKERYLKKDGEGNVVETPDELFRRVAGNIAQADKEFDESADLEATAEEFYQVMANLEFLPNSPTLMNAGNEIQQLSACFVLPVTDSIEGIFDALKYTALIHKSGGGTGFSFSKLRPKNDVVLSTRGVSSGPVSFMKVFDAATEAIKQGGKRRGANMGILRIDHPDSLEFVVAKQNEGILSNFNISVGATREFMEAVLKNADYDLRNPRNGQPVKKLSAREVFNLLVTMAWRTGDPGMIFLDRINEDNPTPAIGEIEATNPCGEQPLLPFESCNLGSVNLAKCITEKNKKKEIAWEKLRRLVRTGVHFLDNVIEMNRFPLKKIEEMTKANRKIGLGLMGFADVLLQLSIPYNSPEAEELAKKIMAFITKEAIAYDRELAAIRGPFQNFPESIYGKKREPPRRNATVTTIAPTGTISMIGDASSGIEPLFAISYIKRVMDGKDFLYVNEHFERIAKERGFYSDELMRKIAARGSIQHIEGIPEDVKRVFVTAHDISPEWHVRIQAAFQKHTENAVSKTINFPSDATIKDVEDAYLLAYKLGCKGITIYRDRSKSEQVLNITESSAKTRTVVDTGLKAGVKLEETNGDSCPTCGGKLYFSEGCATCTQCGTSMCKS